MPCSACGQSVQLKAGIDFSKLQGNDGLVTLRSRPDCGDRYTGPYETMKVLVVGLGTERERVFPASQAVKANFYARKEMLGMKPVFAGLLCRGVVAELYGE